MKTDRELLEAAARAAGIEVEWRKTCYCYANSPYNIAWNPLTSNSDAFLLAVWLNMQIDIARETGSVWAGNGDGNALEEDISQDADYAASTRRAIVRAAAAMTQEGGG